MKSVIILLLCGLLAPVAVSQQEQKDSFATVTIYREKAAFKGRLAQPPVYLNGNLLCEMPVGRVTSWKVRPGTYIFTSADPTSNVKITIQAGQIYYIQLGGTLHRGVGRLSLVKAEQGKQQTSKLKPLESDRITANDLYADGTIARQ